MKNDATSLNCTELPSEDRSQANLQTDWARLEAMTPEEVHQAALADPDAQPLSPERLARMRRVPNSKRIRKSLNNLTQERFARLYQIPRGTLRDWEQGAHVPDAASKALLRIIEQYPVAAALALNPDLDPRELEIELGINRSGFTLSLVRSHSTAESQTYSGTEEMDVVLSRVHSDAA